MALKKGRISWADVVFFPRVHWLLATTCRRFNEMSFQMRLPDQVTGP
jgi:hypothetical protein